jgi:hypothetical protein
MSKGYTLNYFIEFFGSIPDHRWTEGTLNAAGTVQMCALGHALAGKNPSAFRRERIASRELTSNARTTALQKFLDGQTFQINDAAGYEYESLGTTPRGRILRALRNRKRSGNIWGYNE